MDGIPVSDVFRSLGITVLGVSSGSSRDEFEGYIFQIMEDVGERNFPKLTLDGGEDLVYSLAEFTSLLRGFDRSYKRAGISMRDLRDGLLAQFNERASAEDKAFRALEHLVVLEPDGWAKEALAARAANIRQFFPPPKPQEAGLVFAAFCCAAFRHYQDLNTYKATTDSGVLTPLGRVVKRFCGEHGEEDAKRYLNYIRNKIKNGNDTAAVLSEIIGPYFSL